MLMLQLWWRDRWLSSSSSSSDEPDRLSVMPRVLLSHQLSFLNLKDHLSAARSCKALNTASQDKQAWSGSYVVPHVNEAFLAGKSLIRGLVINDMSDTNISQLASLTSLTDLTLLQCAEVSLEHLCVLPLVYLKLSARRNSRCLDSMTCLTTLSKITTLQHLVLESLKGEDLMNLGLPNSLTKLSNCRWVASLSSYPLSEPEPYARPGSSVIIDQALNPRSLSSLTNASEGPDMN